MKAAPASLDRRIGQLGRALRHAHAVEASWSPPPLTELIGRIDTALRERATH